MRCPWRVSILPGNLPRWGVSCLLLLALLYGGLQLAWYWDTPLGRAAVLDERENLQLAHGIATGTLPPEPFYRAMGYPLVLSGLDAAGLLPDGTPQAATALGLLLHVLNTGLALALAQKWFRSAGAAALTGVLFALNPVLLHEATQVLDNTLSGTLLLAGLLCLPAGEDRQTWTSTVGLSLAWSAAALVRPQLLLLWLVHPLVWLTVTSEWRTPRRALLPLLVGACAGALLWLAQGVWCWQVGHEFRLMPWQGPYNLWAANHPGANGRYYTQNRLISATPEGGHENPARTESLQLYREATGGIGLASIDTYNAYWFARLQREIAAEPGAWLQLEGRKLVYLLSYFEQYNNKTYAFHQQRSPWLRPNPLGWTIVLTLGTLGLFALPASRRGLAPALGLTLATLAAGVLLSYASSRFRLPIAMLLTVLAGGAATLPALWKTSDRLRRCLLLVVPAALGCLSAANLLGADDTSTFLQDHLLLAHAAERTGDDPTTWGETRAVLALRPDHPEAVQLGLSSYFNLLLTGSTPLPPEQEWTLLARREFVRAGSSPDFPLCNLAALALWRSGDPAGECLWRHRAHELGDASASAALALAGLATPEESLRWRSRPLGETPGTFLLLAAARLNPAELERWRPGPGNAGWRQEMSRAANRLFTRR